MIRCQINVGSKDFGLRLKIMRTSVQEIIDNYQVRKTAKQKRTFRRWLSMHSLEHSYKITKQVYKKGRGHNLIIGNPETATVILTAHYDTPPSAIFPIATIVGNVPMYILSQILIFAPVIGLAWAVYFGLNYFVDDLGQLNRLAPFLWFEVPVVVLVLLIIWCLQMMIGFANRHNVNDNTSGVAVLISLLEDLPVEKRAKVCFVLFDEEEKGLEGAKAFKAQYASHIKDKPLINFDCVAHGKTLLFVIKKGFKKSKYFDLLTTITNNQAVVKNATRCVYASDQLLFKNGVGVVAVHKIPFIGYYLSRLHSRFDTKFDEKNIEKLKAMMIELIINLP